MDSFYLAFKIVVAGLIVASVVPCSLRSDERVGVHSRLAVLQPQPRAVGGEGEVGVGHMLLLTEVEGFRVFTVGVCSNRHSSIQLSYTR